MTTQVVADDTLGKLARRQSELFRRVQQGTLPADRILRELQKLIEGKAILPYADEEIESNFGYPEGFRIRSAQEQVETLLAFDPFKKLDASHVEELARGKFFEGAEGWGVIPKPSKVAENYHQALGVVLDLIAANREFKNWREGALTDEYLRLAEKTAKAHTKLDEQPGDFWVVPFQFGLRHRGRSVRRARVLFTENEFGLGAYEMAILLLTHPSRITGPDQLYVDCAGVEYSPSADGDFFACLDFYWDCNVELLVLSGRRTGHVYEQWGAGSAFLAQ